MSSTGRSAGHDAGADCASIPALRTITVTAHRTYTLQLYRAGGPGFWARRMRPRDCVAVKGNDFPAKGTGTRPAAAGGSRAGPDQQGTFGECLHCGQDISANRLTAVPWSRYCITCQELIVEQG